MNASKNVRFTLTSVSDVDSLPFAPSLKAATRAWFQEIWSSTPHKIGTGHLAKLLGTEFHYEGGPKAMYLHNVSSMMDLVFASLSGDQNVVATSFNVVEETCFNHVKVVWILEVFGGSMRVKPELESKQLLGEIGFESLMLLIDSGFMATWADFTDTVVPMDDHGTYSFAFQGEVKSVMAAYIVGLAEKYDIADEIILPDGFAAVDTDDLRELLEHAGYDADLFEVDEKVILSIAQAVVDDDIPSALVAGQRELLEHAGYDADLFEVGEKVILRVAKATMEAEDRFLGIA